jgi:hypothetical protein
MNDWERSDTESQQKRDYHFGCWHWHWDQGWAQIIFEKMQDAIFYYFSRRKTQPKNQRNCAQL